MPLITDPMIRFRQLQAETGLPKTTIYRLMERGEFPRPVQLGPRAVGWPRSWLREWRRDPRGWKARHEAGLTLDCLQEEQV